MCVSTATAVAVVAVVAMAFTMSVTVTLAVTAAAFTVTFTVAVAVAAIIAVALSMAMTVTFAVATATFPVALTMAVSVAFTVATSASMAAATALGACARHTHALQNVFSDINVVDAPDVLHRVVFSGVAVLANLVAVEAGGVQRLGIELVADKNELRFLERHRIVDGLRSKARFLHFVAIASRLRSQKLERGACRGSKEREREVVRFIEKLFRVALRTHVDGGYR